MKRFIGTIIMVFFIVMIIWTVASYFEIVFHNIESGYDYANWNIFRFFTPF